VTAVAFCRPGILESKNKKDRAQMAQELLGRNRKMLEESQSLDKILKVGQKLLNICSQRAACSLNPWSRAS